MKKLLLLFLLISSTAFAGDWPVNTLFAIGFSISGAPPVSVIMPFVCPQQLNYAANFVGSGVSCGTSPSETDTYTIKVAGSSIGTVALGTTCSSTSGTTGTGVTFATTGGLAQLCTPGQRLELDGPATVSGANIAITLVATR